ncbi:hypothetical protein FRX31_015501, partial [Thalictrum thalictroides]
MKTKQRGGRKGSARIALELKYKDPDIPVTRARIFLAVHSTSNDENSPTPKINPQIEEIKEYVANNLSTTTLDLDNDPVARVYGVDSHGRIRGFGPGISKRGLDAKDENAELWRIS